MQNLKLVPLGFQQITVSGATGLTVPAKAQVVIISVDTANVRWRDDGVAPTAAIGIQIAAAAAPYEYWGNLSAIQFFAVSGSPVLNVSYYGISG